MISSVLYMEIFFFFMETLNLYFHSWYLLEVETNGDYNDENQSYAAGIVEGALTWSLIHTHLENTIRRKCQDEALEKQCLALKDYFEKSVNKWKNYAESASDDPYWHHVRIYIKSRRITTNESTRSVIGGIMSPCSGNKEFVLI